MKILTRVLIAIIPVVMLVACGTTGDKKPGADAGREVTGVEVGEGGAESIGLQGDSEFAGEKLDDPASILAKRTIYFDYDRSDVKEEYQKILKAHATYLANHQSASVILEGHADERGSREYNVGLGERRSNAVRKVLSLQGAASTQMESISFGEERPVSFGHDDSSWKLNRRVEIIYKSR